MLQSGVRLQPARSFVAALLTCVALCFHQSNAQTQTNEFLPEEPSLWDRSLNLQIGGAHV